MTSTFYDVMFHFDIALHYDVITLCYDISVLLNDVDVLYYYTITLCQHNYIML